MSRFTLKELFLVDIPATLGMAILARINAEKLLSARRKALAWASAVTGSFAICMTAMWVAYNNFAASASPKYLSLLLSDRTEVFLLWKQFLAVIAESLPLVSVTIALCALTATLYFFKKLLVSMESSKLFYSYGR